MSTDPARRPATRRAFLGSSTALVAASIASRAAAGDRDWTGREPTRYPEPDIEVIDPRFGRYKIGNTGIKRLHTGMLWAEGPAWNPVGRYLVWSDIPNDEQLRWLAIPAALLMVGAIALITVALRRTPALTVDALLRRPGISVIDLEQPPADAALAVPLASAEGIRRVAERDGGLVLRFDEGDHVHLYARHDDRVYRYTPEASSR